MMKNVATLVAAIEKVCKITNRKKPRKRCVCGAFLDNCLHRIGRRCRICYIKRHKIEISKSDKVFEKMEYILFNYDDILI